MALDKIDRKILTLLQKDATMPVAEIGRKVGLSTTPCWRRIQKMEEDGVIQRRVAVLDPNKVNVGVTVFVSVKTNEHNEALDAQILRCHRRVPRSGGILSHERRRRLSDARGRARYSGL